MLEEGFAAVVAILQVVDGSRIFEAQLTGHAFDLSVPASCVNVADPFSCAR